MTLIIAVVVVLVLLVVAVYPAKPQEQDRRATKKASNTSQTSATNSSLREQQLREESEAIASEYRRRADEVWIGEIREKASALLGPQK